MMLKHYQDTDFSLLQKWITDARLLLQFAGTDFTYPITQKQISDYQLAHPDRHFYMGYLAADVPFAFGEIIPQESGQPRLGRILVGDKTLRNKGLGRYFIKLLLDECKRIHNCSQVELLVWDKNLAAIKCYEAVGFRYTPEKHFTLVHQEINYNLHKMFYELI